MSARLKEQEIIENCQKITPLSSKFTVLRNKQKMLQIVMIFLESTNTKFDKIEHHKRMENKKL